MLRRERVIHCDVHLHHPEFIYCMGQKASTNSDVEASRRYFASFADDYHEAFTGGGRQPLHRVINRLFRRKTFQRRTDWVRAILQRHGLKDKSVLDLGCGTGEVSVLAASLGARVTGLDVVEPMIDLSRRAAATAGVADRTGFAVADIMTAPLPTADVTLLVGVIEYYEDLPRLLGRACDATRELLIVVDTRGPLWRRALRYGLAALKGFHLYYRPADHVAIIVARHGLLETDRLVGHSFTAMAFTRRPA